MHSLSLSDLFLEFKVLVARFVKSNFSCHPKMRKHKADLADSNGRNASSRCAYHIPDDLIIEVLSRLPGKTRLKFMCVSKSWRNWISNSMPTSPMSSLLLLSSYSIETPGMSIPLLRSGCSTSNLLETLQSRCASLRNSHPKMQAVHYCNGLFLLSNVFGTRSYWYVFNPATNQCVGLPQPNPFSTRREDLSALVFDPRKSSAFKVVIINDPLRNQIEGQIFSSDNNQWVSFSSYIHPRDCTIYGFWERPPIYLNGALHFLCRSLICMFRFYVEEKCFGKFKIPEEGWVRSGCLGESEGHLFYAGCYLSKLQIWMLRSFDTDKWLKKHTLNFANIGPSVSFVDIMAFHTNMEVLFIKPSDVVFSYYFGRGRKHTCRLKKVCSIGHNLSIGSLRDFVCPYSRCLASLNDMCKWKST